jgi:Tol biopolymer transport system component
MDKKKWIIVGVFVVALLLVAVVRGGFFSSSEPEYTYWEPALSPDGSMLVYESSAEASLELFTLDLSSQIETQLTDNGDADWSPVWSPDGNQVAFSSSRDGNVDIYMLELGSLETVRLTSDLGDDINPSWGGDGLIYFNSNRSDTWEAYSIDPASLVLRKLTSLDASTP